jgi:hypothetical protein
MDLPTRNVLSVDTTLKVNPNKANKAGRRIRKICCIGAGYVVGSPLAFLLPDLHLAK